MKQMQNIWSIIITEARSERNNDVTVINDHKQGGSIAGLLEKDIVEW